MTVAAPSSQAHDEVARAGIGGTPTIAGHLGIARFDHWLKNAFVLPGVVVALASAPHALSIDLIWKLVAGLIAIGLIASSNYTLNEVLDAPFDRLHPRKRMRPVPSGLVNVPLAYAQWVALMMSGLGIAWAISSSYAATLAALWLMGCIYNIPPIRSKDLPYLDVLSEAINNPLRMLAGWFIVGAREVPPASLLVSYWMVGCYFMAIKRYAEIRMIGSAETAGAYRKSFSFYTDQRLLVSIMFYAAAAMLFLGVFIMRYKLELVLSFPLVALVMSLYLSIAFKEDSAVQAPEKLYRESRLMVSVVTCAIAMTILSLVQIPMLHHILAPLAPFGQVAKMR